MKTEKQLSEGVDDFGIPLQEMARGTLVVDEHLKNLGEKLREKNILVVFPKDHETDDEIQQRLLPHRILVTRNIDDFKKNSSVYEYGLIDVTNLNTSEANVENAAKMISDAIIEFSVWSKPKPFLLVMLSTGRATFELLPKK